MAIEKAYPSNPDVVIYATINSLQMWGELLKEADKTQLSRMVEHLETWASKRARQQVTSSDIAFI